MSRAAPPTEAELRAAFETVLATPDEDRTDTGLDDQVMAAIERVWVAGPNSPPALEAAARHELEMQIDGTHAAEAQAAQDAAMARAIRDYQRSENVGQEPSQPPQQAPQGGPTTGGQS